MRRARALPAGTLFVITAVACASASAKSMRPTLAPDDLQSGVALYQQGKYAEAEAALRRAAGPQAQAYLAASVAKQKRYPEAEPIAKAALEADPVQEVAIDALGLSLVGQSKFDEAVQRMSAALAIKDDLAPAYLWRGQAYQHQKETARMVEDYQKFLELAPKAPEAAGVRAILSSLK